MQTLFLAALAFAALIAPASADQFETTAAGAYNDSGLSSKFKEAGAGITARSFDMGRTLQDRGGCCRDRGGDRGRGGDRDYGRRRENGVDRTEREDRRREERERRDKERRDREWDDFKRDWDSKNGAKPYPDDNNNRGGSGNGGGSTDGRSRGWSYDSRWQWREGRAYWWGWEPFIVVVGSTHQDCVYYYMGLRNRCAADCDYGYQGCIQACDYNSPGDSVCKSRCTAPHDACTAQCGADQQVWGGRCPL